MVYSMVFFTRMSTKILHKSLKKCIAEVYQVGVSYALFNSLFSTWGSRVEFVIADHRAVGNLQVYYNTE
jgi:hypothetical protein